MTSENGVPRPAEDDGRDDGLRAVAGGADAFGVRALRGVTLRVWAELGRAQLPVGRAAGLGPGSVVELDRDVDQPVDVFANGHRIGTGRLLLVEDGDWAVRLDEVSAKGERPVRGDAAGG